MSAFKEQVTNLFNERICRFLESCKKESYGDKLIDILNKRIDEGILPREKYITNTFDYSDKIGDLAFFLKDFDRLYYPEKLVSNEVSSKIDIIIENLHKFNEITISINADNFESPDGCYIFFSKMGNVFHQFELDVNSILYESKKDLFLSILYQKVNKFLSDLKIKPLSLKDIGDILKKDNNNNSIHFQLYSLIQYLRDNSKKNTDLFEKIDSFQKIINGMIWYVYSYEMRFYDNFLEIKNKYKEILESKIQDLQPEIEKKFTVIKTVELEDGIVNEEEINLLEETFEFYENLEEKFQNLR